MSSYPPTKTKPWQHQLNVWNKARKKSAYYIAHDMGCGKSKIAIDFANATTLNRILIICPKNVIPVWPGQFQRHSAKKFHILAPFKGSCKQKSNEIKEFLSHCKKLGQPAVIILNYEAIIRSPLAPLRADKSNRILNRGLLLSYDWDLLIADEAHRAKAAGGKISRQLAMISRKSRRRLFLSGTPMPHSPVDVYAQYRALDPTVFGTSYTRFKARYCIMGGFESRQIVEFQNLDELKLKFFSIADHVDADDVLDLPDKIDRTLTCQLGAKARKIYDDLERDFIADVETGIIEVSNALDKLLRLAQIAGGFLVYDETPAEHDNASQDKSPDAGQRATSIFSPKTAKLAITTEQSQRRERIIDNAKIDLTISTLKDLPADENVVIFCRFHNEMDRLREAIEKTFKGTKANFYKDKRTICEVSGRVKRPIDFKDGIWLARETNTLIAQIQAAGEGIDLTAARYNFYFSMGFSLGQYRQSRRRTRRPGQNRKVFYYHIVAEATVDRKIIYAIKAKREIVNSVLEQTKYGDSQGLQNLQHDAVQTALNIFK